MNAIPEELRKLPQWVLWRHTAKDDRWAKVPYPINGTAPAAVNDPSTWGGFDEAVLAAGAGDVSGIGFVLTADDPFTGVDLDKCRDPDTGELAEVAAEIVRRLDSYTEVSPSGRGIRIFVQGEPPAKGRKRKDGIEIYSTGRYLTVTGHHLPGTPSEIFDRREELTAVCSEFLSNTPPPTPPGNATLRPLFAASPEDEALLDHARNAGNGDKFSRLYDDGDWEAQGYQSASEADLALCEMLAFWTGVETRRVEPESVDRLFRRSALVRPKWDEQRGCETYGAQTIRAAGATAAARLGAVHQGKARAGRRGLPIFGVADLLEAEFDQPDWLWEGLIGRGMLTELHAAPKLGKTTLLLHTCRAMLAGKPFIDRPTAAGIRILYLTEQSRASICQSLRSAGLLDVSSDRFMMVSYPEVASQRWKPLMEAVRLAATTTPFDLLIVDTVAQFAGLDGDAENQSGAALSTLRPLQQLIADFNIAVLVVRHDGKGKRSSLSAARGSSAWTGGVDITVGMTGDEGRTRRTLKAIGRGPDIPGELVIELSEEGYAVAEGSPSRSRQKTIREALPQAPDQALTLNELARVTGLHRNTVERQLEHLEGVQKAGTGKKGDPYRFWLSPAEVPVN